MKSIGKSILTLACAGLVLIACLFGVGKVLEPHYDGKEHQEEKHLAYSVLFEEPDTLDVLFVGDSISYAAISPRQMFQAEGFTSYNIATGAQPICYGEAMLEMALRQQNPQVVVLEANSFYTNFTRTDVIKQKLKGLLPIFEYHDRWKTLLPWGDHVKKNANWGEADKGHRTSGKVEPPAEKAVAHHMEPTDAVDPVLDINQEVIGSMVDMCRNRGIEVIIVNAPSVSNWGMKQHNAVQEVASRLDIPYVDLNMPEYQELLNVDWTQDTNDGGDHLNKKGAKKVSGFLGAYLAERYRLPDHRGEAGYDDWNKKK